jgi:hypothetical protein
VTDATTAPSAAGGAGGGAQDTAVAARSRAGIIACFMNGLLKGIIGCGPVRVEPARRATQ